MEWDEDRYEIKTAKGNPKCQPKNKSRRVKNFCFLKTTSDAGQKWEKKGDKLPFKNSWIFLSIYFFVEGCSPLFDRMSVFHTKTNFFRTKEGSMPFFFKKKYFFWRKKKTEEKELCLIFLKIVTNFSFGNIYFLQKVARLWK